MIMAGTWGITCVMKTHKAITDGSTKTLLARRRRLVARLQDVDRMLAGRVVEQTRRCGRSGCRCADGEPHGPYAYFSPRVHGRGRLRYVPTDLVDMVRDWVARGDRVQEAVDEIAQINAELLARRELR